MSDDSIGAQKTASRRAWDAWDTHGFLVEETTEAASCLSISDIITGHHVVKEFDINDTLELLEELDRETVRILKDTDFKFGPYTKRVNHSTRRCL